MGQVSNKAKQQYNASHYAQVKVSVNPATASEFKTACAACGVSMASVLSGLMSGYCHSGDNKTTAAKKAAPANYTTRGKRREAVSRITQQLKLIADAETAYMESIPENFGGSSVYERAEQSVSSLEDVIEILEAAYHP
jgi:hypothetical protein